MLWWLPCSRGIITEMAALVLEQICSRTRDAPKCSEMPVYTLPPRHPYMQHTSKNDRAKTCTSPPTPTLTGCGGCAVLDARRHFQRQLDALMGTLRTTTSHFIRCVKPNEEQAPGVFDAPSVMTQLRYSGMCAALLLMQAGFPTRIAFTELHERYAPRMPHFMAKLNPMTFCEALLVRPYWLGVGTSETSGHVCCEYLARFVSGLLD